MDADELAAEIVSSAANSLCLDMRFMTMAVFSLRREIVPGTGLPECDGSIVRFRRDSVISDYREERNMVTRQLAHCVFHCLLGHTDPSAPASRLLAEDMIVEYVLDTVDKSSIFRSLEAFEKHHVVHSIDDGTGSVKYEVCEGEDECTLSDMHTHFYCEKCHKTFCLKDITVPVVPLPEGFETRSINYIIKGTCPSCRNKA